MSTERGVAGYRLLIGRDLVHVGHVYAHTGAAVSLSPVCGGLRGYTLIDSGRTREQLIASQVQHPDRATALAAARAHPWARMCPRCVTRCQPKKEMAA